MALLRDLATTFTRHNSPPPLSLCLSHSLFPIVITHNTIFKNGNKKKDWIVLWWLNIELFFWWHVLQCKKKVIKCQPNKCCDHSSKWKWIHHIACIQTKYKIIVASGNVNGWLIQWGSGNVRSRSCSCSTQSDKCWWNGIRQRSGNRNVLPSTLNKSFERTYYIHTHTHIVLTPNKCARPDMNTRGELFKIKYEFTSRQICQIWKIWSIFYNLNVASTIIANKMQISQICTEYDANLANMLQIDWIGHERCNETYLKIEISP